MATMPPAREAVMVVVQALAANLHLFPTTPKVLESEKMSASISQRKEEVRT